MSSELIAGLGGGLIAIAGAFGVQLVAGAQTERSHRALLIAAFLADSDKVFSTATVVRIKFGSATGVSSGFESALQSLDQVRRSGHELAFLCRPSIAKKITAFLDDCEALTLSISTTITSDEEYDKKMRTARKARKALHDSLSTAYSK